MSEVEPELWVGDAPRAVAFYQDAFGAVVIHQAGDGADIVARLDVDGARFWVAPSNPSIGRNHPAQMAGATARLLLAVDDPEEAFNRAIAAGARELSPVQTEHGWTIGRVVDPFGHEWEIARPD
ncbi:MAG: VOC family protein [Solirubrobacterales bacterium]|nr:VOC family protein [Solirubrobacterales bacterium]